MYQNCKGKLFYIYTLVNFHWARVQFQPVPLASCGSGSGVNSPAAVSFTVLFKTPRRHSYFQIPPLCERC